MDRALLKKQVFFTLAGVAVVVVAGLNMLGWILHFYLPAPVLASCPAMKFNTALVFVMVGATTILLYNIHNKTARYLYYGLAISIFFIGFITGIQLVFNVNTGIDNFIITDHTPVSTFNQYPGRMAWAAAVAFCLLGVALTGIASTTKWHKNVAQYLLHAVGAISYVELLGNILNVYPPQNCSPFISMAFYTSVLLFFVSSLLTFYNQNLGVTGLFTGNKVGNEMVRRLFPLLMLVIIILSYIRIKLFAIHLVSIDFGVALSGTIFLAIVLLLLRRTARQLNNIENSKQQAEEASNKLNMFVEQAPSALAMCDNNMVYMAVSQQWIKDYKMEDRQVIGRLFYDVSPEIPPETRALHQRCLKGETSKSEGRRFVWPDGREQWLSWDIRPWYDAEGKIGGLLIYTFDVTSIKKKEALIKETTERLAEAQQIAHVGSWEWDITGGDMIWSDQQYRIYGFEPGEADPNSGLFYCMLHPDDKDRVIGALGDALIGTKPYAVEFKLVRKDGSICQVDARGKVLRNKDGQPVRFIGTLADISERKKKEAIIEETSERLADAQRIAHVGSWEWDLQTDELKWSDEHYRIFGFEPDGVVPSSMLVFSMLHPDDKERMVAAGKARNKGEPYISEFRIIRADGTVRDIEVRGKALFNKEGKPVRMVGTSADISERKKLERELALSEKEFRSSFENSAIGMALTSNQGRFLKVNSELARMLGYTEAELLQLTFMDVTAPDMLKENVAGINLLATKTIEKYETEKKYLHKNGSIVWAHLTVSTVFNEQQQPLYMVSQMSDITERKRIEKDLQRVNTELNSLFNAETHVSIIGTDLNGVITHFSRGAEILLGYSATEMIGICTPAILHDKAEVDARAKELSALFKRDVVEFEVFVALAESGNFESREWTYIRKDGTRLPVQLVVAPTKDTQGNIKGYLGIATDITERKEAEETRKNNAVLQSRNKEMEEFAYIASHDLQEPLRTVTSFIRLLNEEYAEHIPPDAQQYLQFITASAGRMRELIKGLLEFSRLGKQKTPEPVDCNKLVYEMMEDLGEAINESNAEITFDILPVINALPTEMKQLFQNLVSNAIKFRKPGIAPQIHISATPVQNYWQFEISDNGIGIDPMHYHKIFILFQRLHKRDDYPGTGIGLSYCKKIVELHHGHIWVESVQNEGSRFFFTIRNLQV